MTLSLINSEWMNRLSWLAQITAALLLLSASAFANLITNGSFEDGTKGWSPLWTREPSTGTAAIDSSDVHSGTNSMHIVLQGTKDFSFSSTSRFNVDPGDIYELEAWVKIEPTGNHCVTLSVETLDAQNKVVSWIYGATQLTKAGSWEKMHSRFIIPASVARIQPRLIGNGAVSFRADDFSLTKKGNIHAMRDPNLPATLTLTNAALSVTLDTHNATLTVIDQRNHQRTTQHVLPTVPPILKARATDSAITFTLLHTESAQPLEATIRLDGDLPEFTFEIAGDGELHGPLSYPAPFISEAGEYLVLAVNEGISYPAENTSIEPHRFLAYCGHSYSMPFWGSTTGERGHLVIIETPDDAALRMDRADSKLLVAPEWQSQCGQFGYPRRLRYVFFDRGGHVAMAKRYRAYAQKTGLFKTLEQKRRENPNVDQLIGAVNVWYWDKNSVAMAREMQSLGMQHLLWSAGGNAKEITELNDLHVLTSRYDIFQDVMDPANFPKLKWVHPDWPAEAWPQDLILKANGDWQRGWAVDDKDGARIDCGVLCDKRAPDYAVKRITADLEKRPFHARFIDTTTAAPWQECYNPAHPMTRSESRHWKMELLRIVSEQFKLVTGTETGHDAAVPYVHYFEGMLSLSPYRVPDAGREMIKIWNDVPDNVRQFQVGHEYRLPLWELVYHDCVVAHWYWGDYNNKLPSLWDKRDLFNILYGTAPMFLFKRDFWDKNKDRFVQSYRNVCPIARSVGYSEMTGHRFLTPDRSVQQTTFANGTTITVNFGDNPYTLTGGITVAPRGFHVH